MRATYHVFKEVQNNNRQHFECLVIGWGGGVSGMVVEERKEGEGEPLMKTSNGARMFGPGTVGGDRERLTVCLWYVKDNIGEYHE